MKADRLKQIIKEEVAAVLNESFENIQIKDVEVGDTVGARLGPKGKFEKAKVVDKKEENGLIRLTFDTDYKSNPSHNQTVARPDVIVAKYSGEVKPIEGPSNPQRAAKDLKKGDIILSTGWEVVDASSGVRTPSGKVDVTIKDKKGKVSTKQWNAMTKISIKPFVKENNSINNTPAGTGSSQAKGGSCPDYRLVGYR